jgi:hypothetical protein
MSTSSYTAEQLVKFKEELAGLLIERKECIIIMNSSKDDNSNVNSLETDVDKYLKEKSLSIVVYCRLVAISPQIDHLTDILLNHTDEYKDFTVADLWNKKKEF